MFWKSKKKKNYEACIGCGICLLSCPVWHRTKTMSFTRKARAKAIQGGVTCEEIAEAIDSCLLCGACEIACPEGIGLAELNISQRKELNTIRRISPDWYPAGYFGSNGNGSCTKSEVILLPGEILGAKPEICEAVIRILGKSEGIGVACDDGRDIAMFLEAGLPVPQERIGYFIEPFRSARTLIVAEGLLYRPLRKWLPGKKIIGLGEAILSSVPVRNYLRPGDLYVIESRVYHSDHNRLVRFYDRLRQETGCQTNLDLQRIAVSTGASSLQGRKDLHAAGCVENAGRMLKGRSVSRIVVEDLADMEAFRQASDIPVVHVGLLGGNP
jgi:ferredoxin